MRRLFRFLTFDLFVILMLCYAGFAEGPDIDGIKNKLPKMLGANNAGTEFWITIPPSYQEGNTSGNFIKIFVTSPYMTDVKVSVPGKKYQILKTTIPNHVIEFNIEPEIGQANHHDPNKPPSPEAIYPGAGIHIESGQPIVAYCVVRYMATSDGFLAFPVSAIGNEYIVASYGDMGGMYTGNYPSEVTIVSPYDNNNVTFTLGGNVVTRTSGGLNPGESRNATLNKGDVWLFSSYGYDADLTGSIVHSDFPVGVVSGNFCTNVPTTNRWCDYTVEMDVPTYTWGKNLHIPKVPGRKYPSLIRIFAKEPDTKVYRDGVAICNLTEGGGMINKGWFEARMVPMGQSPRSVVISGDKPIGVTLYNTGVQEDGNPMPNSDPFAMSITPIEQYQNEITFCTPGINGGMNFHENYINLVYEMDQYGNLPYDFEIGSYYNGELKWEKLREKFQGFDEPFIYNFDERKFAVKTITLPNDGVYRLKALKPFAAYSFGYDWCDSYGYPAAAATMEIQKIDIKPPDITYSIGSGSGTGAYISGSVKDMPEDESNRTNLAMIVFHSDASFNYDFSNESFVPGENKKIGWELNVKDKTKDAVAFLTFTDKNGNDTTAYFEYKAIRLDAEDNYFGMSMKTGFAGNGSITIGGIGGAIQFYTEESAETVINLYNEAGILVKKPLAEKLESGTHTFYLDTPDIPNGTYILIISNGNTHSSAMVRVMR